MPEKVADIIGDSSIAYCAEEWGEYERGRLVFSCFSFLAQVNTAQCEKTRNLLSLDKYFVKITYVGTFLVSTDSIFSSFYLLR